MPVPHTRRQAAVIGALLLLLLLLLGSAWRATAKQTGFAAAPTVTPPTPQHAATGTAPARTATPPPQTPALVTGPLRVSFIDVGQGDSILIQTPDGATALIDGGYDNGMALTYLRQQGVTHLDVMIASHPHADHIGGLVAVLRAMPVGGVWTSGASHTTGTFEAFLDAIAETRTPYHEVGTGDTIPLGGFPLQVIWGTPHAADLNDTSLVLRLESGAVSFLFTGDAEQPSEQAMLRADPQRLHATILKVGHHGSATSSTPPFLAAVHPAVSIYSAGRGNSYGHPRQQVLDALHAVGATVYGTDRNGSVVVTTDGTTYQVATSHQVTTSARATPTAAARTVVPTAAASPVVPTPAPLPAPTVPRASGANPCRQRGDGTQTLTTPLRIVGVDKVAEVVTIQNVGSTPLDLTGWTICSLLGHQRHAQLTGTISAGATQAVPSQAGRAIWNNRAAESAAVYTGAGKLVTYWSEVP